MTKSQQKVFIPSCSWLPVHLSLYVTLTDPFAPIEPKVAAGSGPDPSQQTEKSRIGNLDGDGTAPSANGEGAESQTDSKLSGAIVEGAFSK